ncbi:MAG: PaaI family thioesterase [Verrucomicrobia bacterium]|nr:MAG: PaaI family thioesterase [Verrucomicrobiota bacterium]
MSEPLLRSRGCFVCGVGNPAGLKLAFRRENGEVRAEWTPRPEFAGYKGVVHGGLSATVLDEAMTWACAVASQRFCYAAEMTVRYLAPVRPGETLTVRARLTANRRQRLFEAAAELTGPDGRPRATASGKYLPIPPEALTGMADDFLGDAAAFGLPAGGG